MLSWLYTKRIWPTQADLSRTQACSINQIGELKFVSVTIIILNTVGLGWGKAIFSVGLDEQEIINSVIAVCDICLKEYFYIVNLTYMQIVGQTPLCSLVLSFTILRSDNANKFDELRNYRINIKKHLRSKKLNIKKTTLRRFDCQNKTSIKLNSILIFL